MIKNVWQQDGEKIPRVCLIKCTFQFQTNRKFNYFYDTPFGLKRSGFSEILTMFSGMNYHQKPTKSVTSRLPLGDHSRLSETLRQVEIPIVATDSCQATIR